MADWWDDPSFGKTEQKVSPDWADDPAFKKSTPKSAWGSLVDTATHALGTIGEGALHAVPSTIGFLGDLANTAAKGFPLNPVAAGTLTKEDIPGQGPVSQRVNQSYNAAESSLPADQVPTPRNLTERVLNAAGGGAASMLLLGGPENAGSAVLSGIGQGVGGQAGHELFPGSDIAPLVGSLVGGGIGIVPHVAGAVRTGSLIRAGMAHPDYEALVDGAIIPNEGGGSLEHPKTNPISGAEGVMQVTPATARDPGYGIRPWDGKSQADLARVGRQKFAVLLGKYDDPEKALAAYDWGEGNLNKAIGKYGDAWYDHAPDETQKYVANGMTRVYGGPLPHEPMGPPGPDGLPTNGSVVPIDAKRIAAVMQDQEMMNALDKPTPDQAPPAEVLTPAEKQEMDASADRPPPMDSSHEKFTPNIETPVAANDVPSPEDLRLQELLNTPENIAGAQKVWDDSHEQQMVEHQQPDDYNSAVIKQQGGTGRKFNLPPGKLDEILANNDDAVRQYWQSKVDTIKAETGGQEPPQPPREPPVGGDGTGGGQEPPVPPSGGEPPASDPVQKLRGILGQMDELRSAQDTKIQQIRQQRYSEAGTRLNAFSGEAGANATMSALKGKLPETEINSFRKRFSQEDLDGLFNQVQNHPAIDFQTKLRATTGLQKLVSPVGNRLPTRSELDALGLVFPKDVVDGLKKHSSLGEIIANTLSIPRALMASADFSAPLRQGVFMIGRKEFYGAAKGMFKKAFSQSDFDAMQQEIASRPTYGMMQEGGLSLTAISHDITKREEMFMSNYAERLPGIGHVVKGSDRAYVAFLNKVRADVFDNLVKRYEELNGESIAKNSKALRDLSGYINAATGRGSLGKFTQSAPFLSAGLFAPRLIASRLTLLNPLYYARLDPFVRREALKDLFKFAGTALTVTTLAKLGGLNVEADPRSTDFGKIRIKDTRFDILGGFQQYIRTFAQIITSQSKNSDTGKIMNLVGGLGLHLSKGEDQGPYKPTTAFDEATRLVVNKAAPVPGMALDMLRGGNAVGQPLDWSLKDKQTGVNFNNPVIQRVTPLVIQDTIDALKEYKATSGIPYAVAGTGLLGVGTQTYQPVKHAKKAKSSDDWSNDKAFENFGSFGSKKDGF